MLCERCKIREANIQYTEVVNGVKTEHNFCAQCARELDFGPYSAIFDSDFPLGKLLSGLLGIGEDSTEDKIQQITCPSCGTTYEEFVKNSLFGCSECYGVFDLLMSDNLKQLQGSDSHTGKAPLYSAGEDGRQILSTSQPPAEEAKGRETQKTEDDIEEQIRILNGRLQEAIAREEYEAAASCRDKIKELRKGV